MDTHQLIAMAMQTCQEYAQKMAHHTLNEFEMECYESCCRVVADYMKIQRINFEISLKQAKQQHPEFFTEDEDE